MRFNKKDKYEHKKVEIGNNNHKVFRNAFRGKAYMEPQVHDTQGACDPVQTEEGTSPCETPWRFPVQAHRKGRTYPTFP